MLVPLLSLWYWIKIVLGVRRMMQRQDSDGRAATPVRRGFVTAKIILFLIFATTFETLGDAIVRMGIGQPGLIQRGGLFLVGGLLLFGYGFSLNLAPIEFDRVVGLYIATLFIVWQIVNFVVFRTVPVAPVFLGGSLIVAGGLIVTFVK